MFRHYASYVTIFFKGKEAVDLLFLRCMSYHIFRAFELYQKSLKRNLSLLIRRSMFMDVCSRLRQIAHDGYDRSGEDA